VKNLPFLNAAPSDLMWLVPVEEVMVKSIIMLSKRCDARVIVELIAKVGSARHCARVSAADGPDAL
jgi:hypothetical protein